MMAMMVCCSKTVGVELTLRSEININMSQFFCTPAVDASVWEQLLWGCHELTPFQRTQGRSKKETAEERKWSTSCHHLAPCTALGPAEANVCKEKEKNDVDWLVSCIQENCALKLKVQLCFTFPPQASSGSTSELTAGTYRRSIATCPVSLSHVWDLMSDSL